MVRLLRLSGIKLGTPGANEVAQALTWLVMQQPMVLSRFPITQNDHHTAEGFGSDSYWNQKLQKFIHRCELLGFESPEGRQALAELTATCMGLMASVWRVHGPPASYLQPQSQNSQVKVE